MKKEEIIKEVVKTIRRHLSHDYQILLFGSWARGDAMDTSDIDIGIKGKGKVSSEIMMRIKNEVGAIPTLRGIDIVDLNSVGEEFKKAALEHAQTL